MKESTQYTSQFFKGHEQGSYNAAKIILPIINEALNPNSVIDVGCGSGLWLKVWLEDLGINDLMGIEGPYVKESMLDVASNLISFQDLKEPIALDRKFDLATSFEVAEHLPPSSAEQFVKSLTLLSDKILFSAALIGQEGTYHLNEQVPEYWAAIFLKYDYVPIDYIRPLIWQKEEIPFWYRQNILLFVRNSQVAQLPAVLQKSCEDTLPGYLLRVHPEQYFSLYERMNLLKFIRYKLYRLKKLFVER